jgi:hypothetical protein
MENTFNRIIEVTVTLIVLYLLFTNAGAVSQLLSAAGNVYTQSVKTLQGR